VSHCIGLTPGLTGFASGTATADTQGASLFIVYTDPAEERRVAIDDR